MNEITEAVAKLLESYPGCQYLCIDYSGSGDDGWWDDWTIYKDGNAIKQSNPESNPHIEVIFENIASIMDFDFNNDGCSGRVIVSLLDLKIKVNNNDYYLQAIPSSTYLQFDDKKLTINSNDDYESEFD